MAPPIPRVQPGTNRLLDLLPRPERDRVFSHLEDVNLPEKRIFARPDEPYTDILFPTEGVISVLVPMGEESSVEAAVIGCEGMVGLPVCMGDGRGPHDVLCQVAGRGLLMPSATFTRLLHDCPRLQQLLQRYSLTLLNQTSRSSACNRLHNVTERLARWLLLVHDRIRGDEFGLTQEFLSQMLGVRRPTVSLAAQTLQHAGLITYQWGRISILDRPGLEASVCRDYTQSVDEYERLLGHEALRQG
ncbi:MAG: Crp/Fnr family transcriptional regulator [Chloroflexota bacterium]